MEKKIGLSLSGGGVRAAAHIGVLKSLEKHGIKIDMIAGNSAASIIAALYAVGYSAKEIEDIFLEYQNKKIKGLKLIDLDIFRSIAFCYELFFKSEFKLDGFIKGNAFEKTVKKLCEKKGATKLGQTKIPIAIPSVDLRTADITMFLSKKTGLANSQDLVYYSNINICEAVRASSSLPVVFKPKEIDKMLLVDGGIRQNLPCGILQDMGASVTIGVDVGYFGQDKDDISGIVQIASRCLDIMSYQMVEHCVEQFDFMIFPSVFDVGILNINKIKYCIDKGEKETDLNIKKIDKLIS